MKWICSVCGYVYDGDDFLIEVEDYRCPLCDAKKDKFQCRNVEKEIQLAVNEITEQIEKKH